jgi:predicted CoA-substrate-specific enzyme activase
MKDTAFRIGVDIGSVSLKVAALCPDDEAARMIRPDDPSFFVYRPMDSGPDRTPAILLSRYCRHQGEPVPQLRILLGRLFGFVNPGDVHMAFTGSGGKVPADLYGAFYVNAFRAAAEGVHFLYPEAGTVIEMGGGSSKFMRISNHSGEGIQILDYGSNGECAAGTGVFIDQQAERLHFKVEEIGDRVLRAGRAASIAGRCSVFAKTDMIHAQQAGYQPEEIIKGLCESVVRNYKAGVTKGKEIIPPAVLIGGVAANQGIVAAFRSQFGLEDGGLIVPECHAWAGAIGAAVAAGRDKPFEDCRFLSASSDQKPLYPTTEPLSLDKVLLLREQVPPVSLPEGRATGCYLGIDVGSVSTNLALITESGDLVHGIYVRTRGRPVEVVRESLLDMEKAAGGRAEILGVGITGSGRDLAGLVVGADVVKDEITAHKTGAMHVSRRHLGRDVDTIFEIGGQDSKFISIRNGTVVDFSLNEACAAGTGSFLEEQAGQLGISIIDEFSGLAMKSIHPLKLGERCTVFMEKEMVPYLHQGVSKEDIVAGLALSVVQNYLNRVVKKRPIGEVIFFQGGTAYNDSVAAAFATTLDKTIIVPPFNGIIGAVGAALLARDKRDPQSGRTRFRGWDLGNLNWRLREFVCSGCQNKCSIQEFDIGGDKSYWGDKCSDRYRKRTKTSRRPVIPDLLKIRGEALFQSGRPAPAADAPVVQIPTSLYFYERLPFWRAYFEALGWEARLSLQTNPDTVRRGVETAVAEPCFPVQAAHGHIGSLMDQPGLIFLPHVVNEESPEDSDPAFVCPWGQTASLAASFSPMLSGLKERLWNPTLHFHLGPRCVEEELFRTLPGRVRRKAHRGAVAAAYGAQAAFNREVQEAGRDALDLIMKEQVPAVVLLGRPYNLYDPGVNLNLPAKLRTIYGVNVLPMDFLPLAGMDIRPLHDHMFWNYGRRILQAALWTRPYPNLHLIAISNFKCGPDSYVRHFIEEAAGRPFLFLQLDSHSNDAGVMTRIEAFLESKGML